MAVSGPSMKFISQSDICSLKVPMIKAIEAMERVLLDHGRGQVILPPKAGFSIDKGHINVMPAYVGTLDCIGVKMIGPFRDNPKIGLPGVIGNVYLIDGKTGLPLSIMDARYITLLRTGAITGVAAKYLGRQNSRILGMIGAGAVAPYHALAVCRVLPIEEIRVIDISGEAVKRFTKMISSVLPSVKIVPCVEYDDVVRGADIVAAAARMREAKPIIREDNIARGVLVLEMAEKRAIAPNLPTLADKFVVDDWKQCQEKGGCLWDLVDEGKITSATVHAELGQVVAGIKPGRESDDELIVTWFRGMGCADVPMAVEIYKEAKRRGIGTDLALDFVDEDALSSGQE